MTVPAVTQQEVAVATGIPFDFDAFNYTEPGSLFDPNTGLYSTDGFMPSGWVGYLGGKTHMFSDSTMTTENGAMT